MIAVSPVVIVTLISVIHQVIGSGFTYERWGRTSCRSGASEVYQGYMAGGWYDNKGGGSDYVCLTNNPEYTYNKAVSYFSGIYTTEYERLEAINPGHNNYDVPCVVCFVESGTKFMLPGKPNCPSPWITEYYGYLMSSRDQEANPKPYICLDSNAEIVRGSDRDENGAVVYHVVADCDFSFMPCDPFKDLVPLTCAVCSHD